MPTISTTGDVENAAREMIGAARYTQEHNAPVYGLVSHFQLGKGHDTGVFPKVGQFTFAALTEGVDMTDEEEIGMTTVSVTPALFGAKIILTDKLLRSNVAVNWGMVGKQMGEGYKRLRETELIALFAGLNGGTSLGAAAAAFSAANVTAVISTAKTNRYGDDLAIVHHPNAVMRLARDLTTIGSGQIRPMPEGYSARLMSKAWKGFQVWDVPVFETGEITRDGADDAIGVIMANDALGFLEAMAPTQEKERDASVFGWELVWGTDMAAFELDDTKGAPLTYDAVNPATS